MAGTPLHAHLGAWCWPRPCTTRFLAWAKAAWHGWLHNHPEHWPAMALTAADPQPRRQVVNYFCDPGPQLRQVCEPRRLSQAHARVVCEAGYAQLDICHTIRRNAAAAGGAANAQLQQRPAAVPLANVARVARGVSCTMEGHRECLSTGCICGPGPKLCEKAGRGAGAAASCVHTTYGAIPQP